MQFDPDKYLAKKQAFNPDAYLASKGSSGQDNSTTTPYIGGGVGTSMQDTRLPINQVPNEPRPTIPPKLGQIVTEPGRIMNQGLSQIRGGNVPAGLLNLGNSLGSAAILPFSIAQSGYQQAKIPDAINPVNVIGAPANLLNMGANAVSGLTDLATQSVPQNIKNFGQSPENAQQTTEAVQGAGQFAIPMAGLPLLSKAASGIPDISQMKEARQVSKSAAEIRQATPAINKPLNSTDIINRAQKYIAPEVRATSIKDLAKDNPDMNQMELARQTVINAKNRLIDEKIKPQLDRHPDARIDGNVIADNIMNGVDQYVKDHQPQRYEAIKQYADSFRNPMTLQEVNGKIKSLNAITSQYQRGSGLTKAMIEGSRPMVAAEVDAVNAMRNSMFDKLEQYNEKHTAELRKDYGALVEMQNSIEKATPRSHQEQTAGSVYGRFASPAGVAAGTVAGIEGMAHRPVATAVGGVMGILRKVVMDRNKPAPTIARAFTRLGKTSLEPRNVPAPDFTPKGLLGTPAIQTPPPQDISGLRSTVGTQYMPQVGNRLLPSPSMQIAPEYQSTGTQQADMMNIQRGEYPINENVVRDIVAQGGAKYIGIQDFGKMGKFILFNEPSGGTLALRPEELTPENVAKKVAGFKKK